ncbi:HD domain-containing protein [bacterium]|nr:MAG: HD domain-containing protein [bacterium]
MTTANQQNENPEKNLMADVVTTLCGLIELRDTHHSRHIERVASFCGILASSLWSGPYSNQIDDEFVDSIPLASALHDIGKSQIPSYILMKPAALSPDEREILSSHTTMGAAILSNILWKHPSSRFLRMAREIALSHHERWDGSGYPEGLGGEEIPLAARITAVANIYDVMRSAQVYKPAIPHKETLLAISGDFKNRYDPEIVRFFLQIADEVEKIYDSFEG